MRVPTGVIDLRTLAAAPANPAAGDSRLTYRGGVLYVRDPAGAEDQLGPNDAIDPAVNGLKAWTMDPAYLTAGNLLIGGTLHIARLLVPSNLTVATVYVYITAAGATLTNVGVAAYTAAGALLASSVNTNGATAAAFQTTGSKAITFTTPPVIAAGAPFYLGIWSTGTTLPTLLRGTPTAADSMNVGPNATSTTARRFANANTALTTTAPAVLAAFTAPTASFLFGVV